MTTLPPQPEATPPPRKRRGRWALHILRYGLCIAAIIFLVRAVKVHDYIRLDSATGPQVRLLEQHGDDEFVILRDGQRETIGLDQIHQMEVNGQRVPEIELGILSVVWQVDKSLAALAILMFLPSVLIQSYRLVIMVGIQGLRLAPWNATKLTFAGNFFNFALPGMTGGDLIKAYYITHYTHQKTEVVTTIFLDRAIGLLGMVCLAAVGILLAWDPQQFGHLIIVLAAVFGALLVGIVVIFSQRVRHALRLPELAARLPLGEQLLRIGRATVAMRHHRTRVLTAFILTLILQSIVILSAYVMARALGMHGDWTHYFIYIAIGFLICAVPISPPQAFGVMEYFYVLFFTQNSLNDPSQAVALALAVRLVQLVWAIPGVLVPLLGAHLPSQTELAALENQAAASAAPPVTK